MHGPKTILRLAAVVCLLGSTVSARGQDLADALDSATPIAASTYQWLHINPELGKKELKAHNFIVARLRSLGFTRFESAPSAPTAVIAVFDTGRPGTTIALRAEMDARPLDAGDSEPEAHTPRSSIPGVMHNCGHDAHSAILLGTAALVSANPRRFSGKLVFLFQPAEEVAGGADDIVKDGILARLGVQRIFALHAAPTMPVGTVGVTPGSILAGSNYFTLTLSGRGSHAAAPQDGDDVLLGAMRVAQDLSYAPSRSFDIAARPMVVSLTSFVGTGASNVLPTSVEVKGTIRAFEDLRKSKEGRPDLESLLLRRIEKTSAAYNLVAKWELRPASPPMTNDAVLFAEFAPALAASFSGKVETGQAKGMFSEDFAYYTPLIPALYASLGIAKAGLGDAGVHTRAFTIHPDSLVVGIELMARFAEFGTTGAIAWK